MIRRPCSGDGSPRLPQKAASGEQQPLAGFLGHCSEAGGGGGGLAAPVARGGDGARRDYLRARVLEKLAAVRLDGPGHLHLNVFTAFIGQGR